MEKSITMMDLLSETSPSMIGDKYDKEVRPLLNVIDQLRACGVDDYISLPTVAVVGAQSSGKSSVLEAISGIPLPRGENIVTRCPLEMRMERTYPPAKEWQIEIFFDHNNQKHHWEMDKPEQVTDKINQAQNIIAGTKCDVSDQIISMSVRSHSAPDLTLIDLPGIVHVRREDQSPNIIEKVDSLLRSYMAKENSIMLAVLPANVDLANNAVLTMAHQVDPETRRTIAVITKPDTVMDEQSKLALCQNIRNGGVFKLKEIFMVKSRSPDEMQKGTSLVTLLENERHFFQTESLYRKRLNPETLGFPNLTKALTHRLVSEIRKFLPGLRKLISDKSRDAKAELFKLPVKPPQDKASKTVFLYKKLNEFLEDVKHALSTGFPPMLWSQDNTGQDPPHTMFSHWREHFDWFLEEIKLQTSAKMSERMGEWSEPKLSKYLENQRGEELPFFPNYSAYKRLVLDHLSSYRPMADDLIDKMNEDLHGFLHHYVPKHFQEHEELNGEVLDLTLREAQKSLTDAREKINFLFQVEELVFMQDKSFKKLITQREELEAAKQKQVERLAQPSIPQQLQTTIRLLSVDSEHKCPAKEVRRHLEVYFELANQRIADCVPATILRSLHIEFCHMLSTELIKKISDEDFLDTLSYEDAFSRQRLDLSSKIESLEEGKKRLREFSSQINDYL